MAVKQRAGRFLSRLHFLVRFVGLTGLLVGCVGLVLAGLQGLLSPKKNTWESIPWIVSVPEARLLAVKQKKPILTWAQNGHPLGGC